MADSLVQARDNTAGVVDGNPGSDHVIQGRGAAAEGSSSRISDVLPRETAAGTHPGPYDEGPLGRSAQLSASETDFGCNASSNRLPMSDGHPHRRKVRREKRLEKRREEADLENPSSYAKSAEFNIQNWPGSANQGKENRNLLFPRHPDIVPKYGPLGIRALLFTPSWFSINMGTGVMSILLYNLPYQFRGLKTIAICIWIYNIVLFSIFLGFSIARYTIWPKVFKLMMHRSAQAFFLSTFPMGFATIVNMTAFVGVPRFGQGFATLAWVLWWIDAFVSLLCSIGIPFIMFNYREQSMEGMSGAWLLPVLPPIVNSATGGIVAEYLPPSHARLTIMCSYIIWGLGFPLAFLIMAIYFQRLAVHHLPDRAIIVTVFLPLGPCGQGGFAILQFSRVIRKLAYETGVALGDGSGLDRDTQVRMADAIYAGTIPFALILWGLGMFWFIIAAGSVIRIGFSEGSFPFNMGWWGFTFPIGVFATSTNMLGAELDSTAFRVLGTIFSLIVLILCIGLTIETARRVVLGTMFESPCLGELGRSVSTAEKIAREYKESKLRQQKHEVV